MRSSTQNPASPPADPGQAQGTAALGLSAGAPASSHSEAWFRWAVDSAPSPMWMTDALGRIEFVNRAFQRLAGLAATELTGDAWIALLHPDDLDEVTARRAAAWAALVPYAFEARFRDAEGRWRWMEVSANPRLDASGGFHGYVGLAIDRTEAHDFQTSLRESEERLRLALAAGHMGTWEWNTESNAVSWSPTLEAMHGLAPGTFPGTFEAFQRDIHPDDRERVRAAVAQALEGREDYHIEYRIVLPDGRIRWVEGRGKLFRDGPGAALRMVGVCLDVTERKQIEEAMRESEARYRAVVESQAEMVCRFRSDGTILFVNGAYARALGTTVEALTGGNFWAFVAEEDRPAVRAMLDRLRPDASEIRIENRFETADGPRWTLWTNRALTFDAQGRVLEAQSAGIDITDRKRAEERQRLLLDELNHRVKNTLAIVQAVAQQTFKHEPLSRAARSAFEGRLGALAKAHTLLTRTNWEQAWLHELLEEAMHACGAARDRIAIDGPPVTLAPKQALSMAMAFHELCTNSVKYGALSNDTGLIEVSWTVTAGSTAELELTWQERHGPSVAEPVHRGYGSMMIETALAHELQGDARLTYAPTGLVCRIRAPLGEARIRNEQARRSTDSSRGG